MSSEEHNKFLKRYRAIEDAQEELKFSKEALLRDSGWKNSSSYPDCYWRWSKTVSDKAITTMDVDEALRLEASITPCDDDCTHDE